MAATDHASARAVARRARSAAAGAQRVEQGRGDGRRVLAGDEPGAGLVSDRAVRGDVGEHQRRSGGHRLHDAVGHPLVVADGYEGVGAPQPAPDVGHEADPEHVAAQAALVDAPLDLQLHRALAAQHARGAGFAHDGLDRGEQDVDVLAGLEPPDVDDERGVRRHAQRGEVRGRRTPDLVQRHAVRDHVAADARAEALLPVAVAARRVRHHGRGAAREPRARADLRHARKLRRVAPLAQDPGHAGGEGRAASHQVHRGNPGLDQRRSQRADQPIDPPGRERIAGASDLPARGLRDPARQPVDHDTGSFHPFAVRAVHEEADVHVPAAAREIGRQIAELGLGSATHQIGHEMEDSRQRRGSHRARPTRGAADAACRRSRRASIPRPSPAERERCRSSSAGRSPTRPITGA
jgi:hypothetical protein